MDDEIVTVRMGKNGLTSSLIEEIRCVLRKRKRMKVKMLKTALGKKGKDELVEEIRKAAKARSAHLIGHIITLEQ